MGDVDASALRRLKTAMIICTFFTLLEFFGGWLTGSLAIMTDAAHMFCDSSGFLLSWIAIRMASRIPTDTFTLGFQQVEVLGALMSMVLVWIALVFIVLEGIERLQQLPEIHGKSMLAMACIGLALNLVLLVTLGHQHHGHGHSHADGGDVAAPRTKCSRLVHDEMLPTIIKNEATQEEEAKRLSGPDVETGASYGSKTSSTRAPVTSSRSSASPGANRTLGHKHGNDGDSGYSSGGSEHSDRDKHGHGHGHGHGGSHTQCHGHAHDKHDHSHGHAHEKHDHSGHAHDKHDHSGHAHEKHDHSGHNHAHSHGCDGQSQGTPAFLMGHHNRGIELQELDLGEGDDDHDVHRHAHGCHGHANMALSAAMIHVIGDILQSVGVIVAALFIWLQPFDLGTVESETGTRVSRWNYMDPICSMLFGILVFYSTWHTTKKSVQMLVLRAPEDLKLPKIRKCLRAIRNVSDARDISCFVIGSKHVMVAASVVVGNVSHNGSVVQEAKRVLERLGATKTTIQVVDSSFYDTQPEYEERLSFLKEDLFEDNMCDGL